MRQSIILVAGILAVCGTLFFTQGRSADAERLAAVRVTNVATVDIEAVIDDYVRKTGTYEALSNQYTTKRRTLQFIQEQIQSMMEEAEVYPRGSQRGIDLMGEIQAKRAQLKAQNDATEAWYDSQQAKLTAESYQKAVEVIERIARQRNLDLVLMKKTGRVDGMMMNQVSSSIVVRTVIFAKDALDITDQVKALLNK